MDKVKILKDRIIEKIVAIEQGVPMDHLKHSSPERYYALIQLEWVLNIIEELNI